MLRVFFTLDDADKRSGKRKKKIIKNHEIRNFETNLFHIMSMTILILHMC